MDFRKDSVDDVALRPEQYSYRYRYYHEQDFEAIETVLKYLSTGVINFEADNSDPGAWKGWNNAEAIFTIAHDLQYGVLIRRAVNFLRETLIVENVMARLTRAFKRSTTHKELLTMYEDFFYENWDTILKSGTFDDFHETADVNYAIKFGEWFSWGMLNRAINDETKLYNPEEILNAFVKAERHVLRRTADAEI